MALTKRIYVDGETIITAQNLNDIQDEIISHANTFVPKTRTINSKALSSNITLNAADVGAVPTTRTVNGKALSSNIELSASDVGAPNKNHYSQTTNYGLGTDVGYGHVKLSDSNSSTSDVSGGVAATPKAVLYANELVATVETGSSASKNYSAGELVVINGRLWRIIADITSGQTFSTNTNISRTNVSDEINSLWQPYDVGILSANTTKTLTVPSNSQGIFIVLGANTNVMTFILYSVTSQGAITMKDLTGSTGMTFTLGSANTISIANSTTANPRLKCFCLTGNVPTLST